VFAARGFAPHRLLDTALDWLPAERVINRMNTSQFTRSARLGLAHQRSQRSAKEKMGNRESADGPFRKVRRYVQRPVHTLNSLLSPLFFFATFAFFAPLR
jgi:hypothetical protein